ncbi:uncharacterized protein BCR38DRAFT_117209 [Pseudomassariella vexata]|uniref:Fe2OG dioxygenase domain-containing protein n=1 Tax=Pseudomassariella vexata TaxID=1141098 RepID=A0A1Y2DB24_9PEZI|nr:uncharacterized protein BCR38DRAFT_117209 [Pseudomassariella vexata]ORY56316.1 hypothetical protein BCR38DRAFT_117209 [Pseudomassariella vexata]
MLPIDASMFPRLSTRKALIVVDAQNDFLSEDGALYIGNPTGLTDRIVQLVRDFRPHGPIVWVRSEFERPRPVNSEQILTSDSPMAGARRAVPRGRRPQANPHNQTTSDCPEGFLSGKPGTPECVRPDSTGSNFHPAIKEIIEKKDLQSVKSFYSAFRSEELVRRLRMRIVTELYICGSLTNVGVLATAIDAASHGFDITIIEDCCGHRSLMRHNNALRKFTEHTGCVAITRETLLELWNPSPKLENGPQGEFEGAKETQSKALADSDGKLPEKSKLSASASDLDSALAKLSLDAKPPTELPELPGPAKATSPPDRNWLKQERLKLTRERLSINEPKAPLGDSSSVPNNGNAVADEAELPGPARAARAPTNQTRSQSERLRAMRAKIPENAFKASPDDDLNAPDSGDDAPRRPKPEARTAPASPPADNWLFSERLRFMKEKLAARSVKNSPDDDLNANSGDDSQDELANTARGKETKAQPQSGTYGKVEKYVETSLLKPTNGVVEKDGSNSSHPKDGERIDAKKSGLTREKLNTSGKESRGMDGLDTIADDMERTLNFKDEPQNRVEGHAAMDSSEESLMGESEPLCEGDTKIVYNVLLEPLSNNIFDKIRDEVRWQRMSHQGGEVPRLVAVQGQVDNDGSMPIYRHPSDESPPLLPFSPTVNEIKEIVQQRVGHPLNHALIQFYRDGNDYISEHSDKTLDIAKGSFIVNVSLGAERTMVLRTKRPPKVHDSDTPKPESATAPGPKREVQRAQLPHNSMCQMGLKTNERWLHAIRQDKRLDREKSEAELAYDGGRISLTFRQIGTFLDRDSRLIWGQGAKAKTRGEAHEVVNGQTPEAINMLQAFGRENQSADFDWDTFYGIGFDVLHISASPRLFTSGDKVVNMRIQLMLAEFGVGYAKGSLSPLFNWKNAKRSKDAAGAVPESLPIKFVDNDLGKSAVQGDIAIMMYLDRVYGKGGETVSQPELARQFARFQQGLGVLDKHRASQNIRELKRELDIWEGYAGEAEFIAGSSMTLADFAFWPVLHDIFQVEDGLAGLENLKVYYKRIKGRESGEQVLSVPTAKEAGTPKK